MDLSSLTEAQQEQLQQLHQQFQQHQQEQQQLQQQQQQQQQQELAAASQPYDPTQVQSYDQSTLAYDQSNQSYYPYSHYPHHHHQQQHYPYYHQDYANAYQPQASQIESTPIQPPGISSVPPEPPGQQQQQQQQNAYYPQAVTEQQQSSSSSTTYPVLSGLNPAAAAAVAALSQLTQFAGTMDAAERAMAGMQERQWHDKGGGGGGYPMPMPHMPPHGGFHHGPYPDHPGAGRSPYNRGGGRRGGGPFRGGRGNFGHRNPRPDGSAPYSRGRGRGGRGGGGRRFPSHGGSSSPYPETSVQEFDSASAQFAREQVVEPQNVPMSSSVATTAGQAPRSSRRPPQIAWCELCRVDCTSAEILEQHKNGKKHKKNLQRFEELQNSRNPNAIPIPMPMVTHMPAANPNPNPNPKTSTNTNPNTNTSPKTSTNTNPKTSTNTNPNTSPKTSTNTNPNTNLVPASVPNPTPAPAPVPLETAVPGVQSEQKNMADSMPEATAQPENVHGGETIKQQALENLPTGATVDESTIESEQQNDMVQHTEVAEPEETEGTTRKRRMDRFDTGRRGLKRKLRGGRGGKRMRMVEQQRPIKHVEPPKEVVPIICDLCNVKCDTQAVFDCHLAGKKHLSKLKRFQGHQAIYGPVGLQALYPPNPSTQPIFIPQVHPHQQPFYVPPQQQMMAYGQPHGQQIGAAISEPKASLDSEMQEGALVTSGGGQKAASVEPEAQKQGAAVTLEQGGQQAVGATSQNGVSESEVKVVTDPPLQQQAVVVPSSEDPVNGSERASQTSSDVVPKKEYGVSSTSSENVTLPGVEMKTEQPHIEYNIKSEEPTN